AHCATKLFDWWIQRAPGGCRKVASRHLPNSDRGFARWVLTCSMRSLTLVLAVVVAAVGCTDSSGPAKTHSSAALAIHMDSLYKQACALAYSPDYEDPPYYSPYFPRCLLMEDLVVAPASGAEPSPLEVNELPGTGWHAFVIDFTDTTSDGTPRDSNFALIAYSDSNVTNGFVLEWWSGSGDQGFIVSNDTAGADAYGTMTVSTVSRGARCSDVQGVTSAAITGVHLPQVQYDPSICQLSTFSVSWDGLFNVLRVDSAYGEAKIPVQTVNGITVTNSPWGVAFAER